MRKLIIVLLALGVVICAVVAGLLMAWGMRQMRTMNSNSASDDTIDFIVVEVCRGPVAGNCILLGFTRDAEGRASHPVVRVAVPYEDAWRYYPGKKMRISKEESVPKSDLLPTFQSWGGENEEKGTIQE